MNSTDFTSDTDFPTNLVKEIWLTAAAMAYEQYLDVGRGWVLVDLRNAKPTSTFSDTFRANLTYSTPGELAGEKEGIVGEMMGTVESYSPETEVVFFFYLPTAPHRYLKAGGSPSPKQAYEREKFGIAFPSELDRYVPGKG